MENEKLGVEAVALEAKLAGIEEAIGRSYGLVLMVFRQVRAKEGRCREDS